MKITTIIIVANWGKWNCYELICVPAQIFMLTLYPRPYNVIVFGDGPELGNLF